MEAHLGHDFSRVRVHHDREAAQSAAALDALAYTAGRHIVFGSGRFVPGAFTGRQLLAHELVHVVQQRGGVVEDEPKLEREADAVAAQGAFGIADAADTADGPAPVETVQRKGDPEAEKKQLEKAIGAGVKDALYNVRHVPSWPAIRSALDAARGTIDLAYLLGWIDQESSGRVGTEHPTHELDEVSLFQISKDERAALKMSGEKKRAKLLTDIPAAVNAGIALIHQEEQLVQGEGIPTTAPAYWHFVRLAHQQGEGRIRGWLQRMNRRFASEKSTVDPKTALWDDIKSASAKSNGPPLDRLIKVDVMFARGREILRVLDEATPDAGTAPSVDASTTDQPAPK